MGYIFTYKDAAFLERRLNDARQCNDVGKIRAARHRWSLMVDMLRPSPGARILDIGCGIGEDLSVWKENRLLVTGVDASVYMIDSANRLLGNRADLYRCMAQELPFDDNEFNYASINLTLEFTDSPEQVIAEACRVTKDRLFIGIVNRFGCPMGKRAILSEFPPDAAGTVKLLSIGKVKRILKDQLGKVPVTSKTVCHFGFYNDRLSMGIDHFKWVAGSPVGAMAGIVATLNPRFRVRPLPLPKSSPAAEANLHGT